MERRSSLFKRAWELLSERPAAYILVTVLPYVVVIGLPILTGRTIVYFTPPASEGWDPVSLWRSMAWGERLLIILAMIASATVPMYMAARGVCRLALDQQRDLETSFGSVLLDMLRFLPAAILYFLLLGIPSFLGSTFFVVPGLMITAACALIIPSGVDGRLGPFAAIRQGLSLIGRVFGRVLAVYACYLGLVIAGRLVLFIAGSDEDTLMGSTAILFALLGLWILTTLLAMIFVNIMVTLLYCEARDSLKPAPLVGV